MIREYAVFNTDRPNKKRMIFPADSLMRAEERDQRESLAGKKISLGMPVHMQHDMHRLIGWSQQLGHYIDGEMVRVLGCIDYPENERDWSEIRARVTDFRQRENDAQTEPYRDELAAQLGKDRSNLSFIRMEAVFAKRANLAAELYPEFFSLASDLVDKDGLVDYREFLSRVTQLTPGIFHDPKRDLVLVAHRFFRRRLSHRNSLNTDFLKTFGEVASRCSHLQVRLKLDPDLIGHAKSVTNLVELEYWRGPHYDDDITNIPSGVAVHKADDQTRQFEGVDQTQIWWKPPEERDLGGKKIEYRTFEVEELIENESAGLDGTKFGCRYAHAEYSAADAAITHFDGAIRAYTGEDYLERMEASIDRAGKRSEYTKLFRFDKPIEIPDWKRLLSDYYRGNNLIPEYLGAPLEAVPAGRSAMPVESETITETPLAAYVSLAPGTIADGTMLYADDVVQIGSDLFPVVEVGVGEVRKHLRDSRDPGVIPIGFQDKTLNLSRFGFTAADKSTSVFTRELAAIAEALDKDATAGVTTRTAIPIMWDDDDLVITLTLAGDCSLVARLLRRLPDLIDPMKMPSAWIEALFAEIVSIAPVEGAPVIWDGVDRGILRIGRTGTVDAQWPAAGPWRETLVASGILKLDASDDTDSRAELEGEASSSDATAS